MFLRNLSDYLQQLISTDGGCLPDTFIQVGADEMPDAFLTAIHDPAGDDNDDVWADFNGAASPEEIPSDGDDDNDGNDIYPENETGMDFDTARPAVEVITQERQAVILGNPGSGKTTLLRQVMRIMARECLQSRLETDIPIYLPLKELSHLETLFGWLETYTAQPGFDRAFAEGRVCLFLDGLNEVQPSEYDTTVRSIRQFLQTFPDCGLIVTSRLYGYAGQLDLPSFLLQDFTDENIRDYIFRRTGDDRLFRCIVEHPSLHGQAKNPLLLNMITSIWLDKGDLPDIRLHLYDEFIRYQLRKAGIVSNEDRQTVIDLLSRMAYSMRRFGYLSDSFSGLDKVVADWVEPGRVGEVSRLILASGLLSVSRKAPDFWCISFIHETFQEYFSTLYIYRDYVATKSLCVDFSQPEWGESLKLLAESLSHGGINDRLQDFLGQVATRFTKGSGTPYFNDGIGRMFATLSDCSPRCTALREWMGQYLLFHMANFLNLPEDSRSTERFEAIVSSLASLNDPALCLLLFRSYRWMAYWLYTVDELELIGCLHNTPTIQIVAGYLPRFGNKVDIYRAMQDVRNAYGCFESVGVRLKYLQVLLANSMDPEECRALYLAIGDMDALLRTGDLAFIEQETAGKSGLVFPAIVNTLRALDVRNIPYFYRTLFERLDEPGKRSLLDPEVLPDFIMQVPGLDEMILKHPAYAEYRERVLKACYTVPEGYLSHYYFNFIEEQRNEVRTLQVTSGCTIYYRSPEGLCYAKPDMADIHHESSVEFQSVKEA